MERISDTRLDRTITKVCTPADLGRSDMGCVFIDHGSLMVDLDSAWFAAHAPKVGDTYSDPIDNVID